MDKTLMIQEFLAFGAILFYPCFNSDEGDYF